MPPTPTRDGSGLGQEDLGQGPVGCQGVGAECLDAHVVCACVEVGGDPEADGLCVAVQGEGVDEPVAATVVEVGFVPPVPQQVAPVVRQVEVGVVDDGSGDGPGLL